MLPKLYKRETNFYTDVKTIEIGSGPNQSYQLSLSYETPGWIAFDFAADVADYPDGVMAEGRVDFYVDGVHRFRARGSYTFTRIYVYVDKGLHHFEWKTNEDFQASDKAWLRRINGTAFTPVENFAVIQQATPPRRLNELNRHSIINGYDRFQQTGPGGVEIEMMMTFVPGSELQQDGTIKKYSSGDRYMEFISDFPNFYMLEYNYGLYGGTIMDPEPFNEGPLTHVDMLFHSPQKVSAKDKSEFLEI